VPEGVSRPPTGFALERNVPNPFASETVIRAAVPEATLVDLTVRDVSGREIAVLSRRCVNGEISVTWDGRDSSGDEVSPGIYFLRMEAGDFAATKKMMVLR
jgi:hypothetical protein